MQLALKILNFDFEGEQKTVIAALKDIVEQYSNLDLDIDKEVFTALLKEYRSKVDTTFLPEIYHTIAQKYNGDEKAFVDSLYASSELTTPRGLKRFLERDTTYQIFDDPAISLGIDMLTMLFDMNMQMQAPTTEIIRGERLLNGAIRRMYTSRNFYPDANSTMRLSFGTVCGYTPFDGAEYDYYTTTKGVLEKVKAHVGDVDFAVQPEILSLLSSGNFGRYADEKGEMKVCSSLIMTLRVAIVVVRCSIRKVNCWGWLSMETGKLWAVIFFMNRRCSVPSGWTCAIYCL